MLAGNFKIGYLFFSGFYNNLPNEFSYELDENIIFTKEIINVEDKTWKEWLGLKWNEVRDSNAMIKFEIPTKTPEVLDRENNQISELISKVYIPFTPELSDNEIIDWYNSDFKSRRKCFFVWRGVFIAPNGDVYPCMGNFYYKMGNILTEDFSKIWNNDKFVNFRLTLKKGLLSVCSRCCRR